jgi:ribonuclease HI
MSKEKKSKRRVIYTDATKSKDNEYKIGLYDPKINLTYTLRIKDVENINEAEKYGILYALHYINEKQLHNAIILSDSKSSVDNKVLNKLAAFIKCKISWVPREINLVADKIVKLEPTQKEKVWHRLKLLHDVAFNKI